MPSTLKIETPLLAKDIAVIEEQIGIIRSNIANMKNAELSLEGMWEGSAKDEFRRQFGSDCEEMENILRILEQYKEKLLIANREYTMSSDNVSNLIKGIRV